MSIDVVLHFEATGAPERAVACRLQFDNYVSFAEVFLRVVALQIGKQHIWDAYAVLAQDYLTPQSPVRRYKGYKRLFLSGSDLVSPLVAVEDYVISPREGMDLLLAIVHGPLEERTNIVRLGLYSESAVLVCGSLEAGSLLEGLKKSIAISPTDAVSWDVQHLYANVPGALLVASCDGPPVGVLRIKICAKENVGYPLLTRIDTAVRGSSP
jgi:hypothetical protein